ncbi:pyocin knob domain-containing protein [Atopobiaceae bacterium 24-176]
MIHSKANALKTTAELLAEMAVDARVTAHSAQTGHSGLIYVENEDGTATVLGSGDATLATHVGDTTPPPVPAGVAAWSGDGTVTVTWDGTLDGDIPADFLRVNLYVDGVWFAALTEAGSAFTPPQAVGATVEVTATSEDDACLWDGTPAHNVSDPCPPVAVEVVDLVSDGAAMAEEARAAAEELKRTAATKVEVTQAVDEAKGEVLSSVAADYVDKATGETLATKSELSQTADGIRSEVEGAYATKESVESLADRSYVDQTASSITAAVESEYLKKGDAETTYASKAEVKVETDRITQTVEQAATDASAAAEKATKVEQTAESLTVTVSGAVERVDAMGEAVDDAAKTATNFLRMDSGGLTVGDLRGSTVGKNVRIDSDSVDIRNGSTTLATFEAERIGLGLSSTNSVVDMCGGVGSVRTFISSDGTDREIQLYGQDGVDLRVMGATESNPSLRLAGNSRSGWTFAVAASQVRFASISGGMDDDVAYETDMQHFAALLNRLDGDWYQTRTSSNLNALWHPGLFAWTPSTVGIPEANSYGMGICISNQQADSASNWAYQFAKTTADTGTVWVRQSINTGGWTAWRAVGGAQYVTQVLSKTYSCNNKNTATVTIAVPARAGYAAVGIVGYNTGDPWHGIVTAQLSGSNVNLTVARNDPYGANGANKTAQATVLYMRQ